MVYRYQKNAAVLKMMVLRTGDLLNTATYGLAVMTGSTLSQGRNQEFIDHLRSGVVYNFGLVCLSVRR